MHKPKSYRTHTKNQNPILQEKNSAELTGKSTAARRLVTARLTALLLAILLICTALLSGCDDMEEDRANTLKKDVHNIYDTMKADLSGENEEQAVLEWIENWANKEKIYSDTIKDCGIILSKPATESANSEKSITYQCRIDMSDMAATCKTTAIALTVLKNSENHGPISVILTNGPEGAHNIPAKYLKTHAMINLTERSTPRLFDGSAASADYNITKKIDTKKPEGNTAYRIYITGCTGDDFAVRDDKHANPIVTIGRLLYDCRNSSIILEIASFNGGERSWTYPTSATAVIVVNSSQEEALIKKLDEAKEEFNETYSDMPQGFDFDYKKTDVPDNVLQRNDTSSVLSLMYMLTDGVFATSEENGKGRITALSNMGVISTKNNKLTMKISARATDEKTFDEMTDTFRATAELADAGFEVSNTVPLWPQKEHDPLAESLIEIGSRCDLDLTADSTFMLNDAAAFYAKDKDINTVSIGVTMQDSTEITKMLVLFTEGTARTK